MKTNRRQFLARTALGVGSALLAPQLLAETKPAPKYFDPYETVPLGRTKLKCLARVPRHGDAGRQSRIQSHPHGQGRSSRR